MNPAPPGTQVDLLKDGVLWMVNRTVYHPRGFALAFDSETGELFLRGDGTEVWSFVPDGVEDEKFAAHEALLERARQRNAVPPIPPSTESETHP